VDAGLIYKWVYLNVGGTWYYYPQIEDVFFERGYQYAIYGFKAGTINLFYPGHGFKADRARRDLIRAAFNETRYRGAAVRTETYGENLSWDGTWELRFLSFSNNGKQTTFYQACNRENPLLRFTGFVEPDSGVFSGWQEVDWNVLQ
jgi:hypothetical protein